MSRYSPTEAVAPGTWLEDEPKYTAVELAERIGRSRWWVVDQVQRGLIPHLRKGPKPSQGKRDVRPILFTEAMAQEVEAQVHHVEVVSPGGAP